MDFVRAIITLLFVRIHIYTHVFYLYINKYIQADSFLVFRISETYSYDIYVYITFRYVRYIYFMQNIYNWFKTKT